jgi:hypothetical protein
MHSQRRFFNIALVFVWALAHGVWIGAGWHASSETAADTSTAQAFHCACAKFQSQTHTSVAGEAKNADACSICQLSTLLPDVPAPQWAAIHEPRVLQIGPLAISNEHQDTFQDCLPPQRGPPAA